MRWVALQLPSSDVRSVAVSIGAMALVIGAALSIVLAASVGSSWRLAAVLTGAIAFPLMAKGSGNPRLFCLWCLMFALPFDLSLYLGPFSDKAGGERAFRIELSDLFLLSLLAFQLRDVYTGRWPGLRVPKVILVWLGIMFFWGLDSLLEARFRTTVAHEMVRMVKMTVLFVVIVNELDTPRRMLQAATAITFGVLFQSGFGLLQYWYGRPLGLEFLGELGAKTSSDLANFSVRDAKVFRISAFVGHPNLFGIYLAACLPLALGGLMIVRSLGSRLFFALASAAGGAALILTQSRSAWASFAAAMVLFPALMLMHRRLFTRSISFIAIGAVAFGIGFGAFQEPIMKRLFDSQDSASLGREEFKEDARRLIDEKMWFGWGLNQYVRELPPYMKTSARAYSWWIPPVHNIYYLWWAETGLVGLMTHLAMWAAIVLMACRNLKVHDETLFIINLGCLVAMVAFAVDGFMSFTLRVNPLLRVYWVLAGMIYATYYWRLEQQHIPWSARDAPGGAP
jgi:O-antigen ligase